MKQLGISPKVAVPFIVNLIVGAILLLVDVRDVASTGLDSDELGVGVLLASVVGAGFGFVASPGVVLSPSSAPEFE